MSVSALLLGEPGRLPFVGHLRVRVAAGPGVGLAIAGRVAALDGVEAAFVAASHLERELARVRGVDRREAHDQVWATVRGIEPALLGSRGGADLSLLVACEDERGPSVSATGIGGLWGVSGDVIVALVPAGHALLDATGIPAGTPEVLHLGRPFDALVAMAAGLEIEAPSPETWRERAGAAP
jgi:hypothetical protein